LDAYSLSKTLHLNGTYSWYTFAENILNKNEITEKNIEVTDFNKEKWHPTKSLKKTLLENYENMFYKFSIWVKNSFLNNSFFFGNERRSVPRLQLHLGDIAYTFVVLYLFYYICLLSYSKSRFFFIFFVSYATCCLFHSKVISTEESGLNIAA
jgi:hypothetical protein